MDPDFNTKRFLLLLINFNFTETKSCYPSSDFSSYFCFPKKLPTKAVRFAGIQSGFVLFKYKKSINTNTNTRRTNLGKLWKKLPAPSICEAVGFYIIQRQGRPVSVINKIRHRTHGDGLIFWRKKRSLWQRRNSNPFVPLCSFLLFIKIKDEKLIKYNF